MTVSGRAHRGADLPYTLLAGVEPLWDGWLVVSGRLLGSTFVVGEVTRCTRFTDILDAKPDYQVIAVHAPIGLRDEGDGTARSCDRAARQLLGWPRLGAVITPPTRAMIERARPRRREPRGPQAAAFRHAREIQMAVPAHMQRTVFEVNPELSFYGLNGNRPLVHPKHCDRGEAERLALLTAREAGLENLIERVSARSLRIHVIDAAADLWTARRIAGHAVVTLPDIAEWDSTGRRMELVR